VSATRGDRFLLDTSAVLALTDEEPGWDLVEGLLDRAHAGEIEVALCAVTLMELYYVSLREQGEDSAGRLVALVKAWPISWIFPDERMLLAAGRLKAFHRLSFADAVVAAAAARRGAVLIHRDPELAGLGNAVAQQALPAKR
jgi:predicted nucleic acid-binding protein